MQKSVWCVHFGRRCQRDLPFVRLTFHARQGPERVKGLYAFRSILDFGGRITLGSDFPVEGLDPLAGFYAAITRVSPEGTSPHGPEGW